MNEPREKTMEETRTEFLERVWTMIDYWEKQPSPLRGKLDGLAFSILTILDGGSDLPAFIVAPMPHVDDKLYHKERGENWYPENSHFDVKADIAGGLHELFYKHDPNRKTGTPDGVRPTDQGS